MSLPDKLKERTKLYHQDVEKVLVKELKSISTLEQYATLLDRLYQFYFPIEKKLQNIIDRSLISDIGKRQHTKRLFDDLSVLNFGFKVEENLALISIDNPSYAIGVLYVIEGSTLGGQIISKMLKKQLQLKESDINITSYFNSYGINTQGMWLSFKNDLCKSQKKIDEEEVMLGAIDTFKTLKNWLLATSF
ncbi:heme oxygenase [Tenacibaculum adriaticum]|uniref:Heme oxygenase n=1 Tax=Tenacibaculum adriaticum TaxID=413713 RepID=A0A5S5DPU7_9FLAO|nr:biliverdin-producing heme oxygenase [Tenacibaculum adriaticum]TYP97963.1 heme oxygenase [Tenacibaculum adriaticum]